MWQSCPQPLSIYVFCHFSLLTKRLYKCVNSYFLVCISQSDTFCILSNYICTPIAVWCIGMATEKQLCSIESLSSSLWLTPLIVWYHHDLHHNICAQCNELKKNAVSIIPSSYLYMINMTYLRMLISTVTCHSIRVFKHQPLLTNVMTLLLRYGCLSWHIGSSSANLST